MSQKTVKLILPFSVLSENRTEPFSEEMQKASIYCFAELEREKGGGLILRKPEEKLAFLAEFCYPLWLVPWEELCLIFDGLKTTAYALNYREVPDVKSFMENMQRSSKTLETYMAFLSDNANYFQVPTSEKAMPIEALIAEPAFLDEFNTYLPSAEKIEAQQPEMAFLPTTIDESAISSIIQELENLKLQFKEDVHLLYESMKLLNRTTRNFAKTIRAKIREIKEEYNGEIKKQENLVTPKINRINEEYDEQVTQLTKRFEKQLLPLQKEKVKLEKTREQVRNKIERCKIEAQACAAKKDELGEKKWKEKANESKKEFSLIENQIEEVEEKIKAVEESRSLETFRLRSEWEAKIREARKGLLELEASRDAKIQIHNQEIEKLESATSAIIQQIDNIVKLREANLSNLEKLGIQQKRRDYSLIYIPFYIACYQAESKKRYLIFPPSTVNSIGFSTKIRGALGKAKVKQLLTPRFKAITAHLNKLAEVIEKNAAFEREIDEFGEKADMLKKGSVRAQTKSGLERLNLEGWFSEKEYEAFNQKLA